MPGSGRLDGGRSSDAVRAGLRVPCLGPEAYDEPTGKGPGIFEDLEQYEAELELQLYREYQAVRRLFTHAVETERRFYLANKVDVHVREQGERTWHEIDLEDAWVWDMYRQHRFVAKVQVVTFRDFNIEMLPRDDLDDAARTLDSARPADE